MKRIWHQSDVMGSIKEHLNSGGPSLRLTGMAGSVGASLIAELTDYCQKPFMVVVRNSEEAVRWIRDLKFFMSEPGDEMLTGGADHREPGIRGGDPGRVILFPEFSDSDGSKESTVVFSAHMNASLYSLRTIERPVAIVPASFLAVRIDTPGNLLESSISIDAGMRTNIRQIIENLAGMGYDRVMRVESPGEFAFRGGILDVFIPVYNFPVRIEYFGDEVISIREFDPLTQRSISRARTVRITRAVEQPRTPGLAPFFSRIEEWVGPETVTVWIEPDVILEELRRIDPIFFRNSGSDALPGSRVVIWESIEERPLETGNTITVPAYPVPEYDGDYRKIAVDFRRWTQEGSRITIVYHRESVRRVVAERLASADLDLADGEFQAGAPRDSRRLLAGPVSTDFIAGELSRGFRIPELRAVFVTERDIVGSKRPQRWKRSDELEQGLSFRELCPGDLVVHVDHGIGRYDGLHRLSVNGKEQDFLLVRYAEEQKLYIPVDRLYLIQRYIAPGDTKPALDRMGGVTWRNKKRKVRESVLRLAAELLKLFSEREVVKGFAFPPDDVWQQEFELGFEYEETPDQLKAIFDVKNDMESSKPMDRVVCGDVGYGKTEVAMRAAFKAAVGGKQVAVLVPTTILAQQHFRSFQKRFNKFPVKVAMLSRFLNQRDRKVVLDQIAKGSIDIVIGTHALLGDSVRFSNLGLLIIDEEHRFGVRHKERLKQLRNTIDVLTLTATPIPRTLNMSLLGLREISLINTPPEARLPIKTRIARFDREMIRRAILDEINRGGQVYFVHNRVHSIHVLAEMLRKLVPEARIGIGHGQMTESALENIMLRFLEKEFDVLVCTTIIESGLDIPSVNTIIINRADQLGLAQLYQLRGRVGRDRLQAFAWLLVPATRIVSGKAKERLTAIRQAVELGSGFSLAAKDLDIRGAGDILGPNQHGQISAVGFEMYCRLIREAVQELKGEQVEDVRECEIRLPYDLAIPESYIEEPAGRLDVYRRFSTVRNTDQIDLMIASLKDQYGEPPDAVRILADVAGIRIAADKLDISLLEYRKNTVAATFRNTTPLKPESVMELIVRQPRRFQFNPPSTFTIVVGDSNGNDLLRKTRHALEEMVAFC